MSRLIVKKHLINGFEIRGYGWEHFKRMYNLHSSINGFNDYISDGEFDWESHVKNFNDKKKTAKKIPTTKNTVDEIKKWLEDNKVPLKGAKIKAELLELVRLHK